MPYEMVDRFEKEIAKYAGAKYGVAVESCCSALLLSLEYRKRQALNNGFKKMDFISIPKRTYPGVACSIIHARLWAVFTNKKWRGVYELSPANVFDSALRFKRGMYIKNSLYCLSFHAKKHIPIGRGGMILTDDKAAYEWLKKARFDGRAQVPLDKDNIEFVGWNAYMTPEQAARGLMLFSFIKNKDLKDLDSTKQGYPDLSTIEAYRYGQAHISFGGGFDNCQVS